MGKISILQQPQLDDHKLITQTRAYLSQGSTINN